MLLLLLLLQSVKKLIKILFYIISALYPVVIFTMLVVLKLPVRILSLCVIALALAFFLSATGNSRITKNSDNSPVDASASVSSFSIKPIVTSALLMTAGIACFLTNQTIFLRMYAVVISVMMLIVFGSTLFFPPNIIFRFACLADKSIKGSLIHNRVERYCKKVCIVWCGFFILNGSISVYTAFFASEQVWAIYNGGISYVLMGLLFGIEYIIRIGVNKKMPKVNFITKFNASSFADDHIMSYEGRWSDKKYKTWHDFLVETARMRKYIQSVNNAEEWILHCEDYWLFTITFVALLQCKKTVLLTQNITEGFLSEIHKPGIEFLTDQKVSGGTNISVTLYSMPTPTEEEIRTTPIIDSDSTKICMFTSGSTGTPKGVDQRMTEFELDNAFIISKWGEDFINRKLVATVSQHHIYGFLFTISLPFALGVPVRRKRIEFPEEFTTLDDEKYMIIATPAFLKRTVDAEEGTLPTKDCFIFTSGGVLTYDVAEKTDKTFGFWPVEVYGSTETSGIAWRKSCNGQEWTPFDNAKIWLGDDGCLRIISPYIKNPEGFATADLAEMLADGRFLLKGRSDSIVKIEEKRISMTEVENRLLDSGLVADVKVVAMEDRRQYLAAALELNKKGKSKFANSKKLEINKFFHNYLMQYFENVVIPKKWRFVEKLPSDIQGKKHKEDIIALFE